MRRKHMVVSSCICVYLCVCNFDFSKVTKHQALANAVQAQHDNISNLIVIDFELGVCSLFMAWFAHLERYYGSPCNLDQYNRYSCLQWGTVLANWISHAQIVHVLVSLLGLPNWLSMLGSNLPTSTHVHCIILNFCIVMMNFVAMYACCLCCNSTTRDYSYYGTTRDYSYYVP